MRDSGQFVQTLRGAARGRRLAAALVGVLLLASFGCEARRDEGPGAMREPPGGSARSEPRPATQPAPATRPAETSNARVKPAPAAAPATAPASQPSAAEDDAPDYIRIVEAFEPGERSKVRARVENGRRLIIDTTNVKRLRIFRDRLTIARGRTIALLIDGQGIEWRSSSRTEEFERSQTGDWSAAGP